jgi:hypothetical protein
VYLPVDNGISVVTKVFSKTPRGKSPTRQSRYGDGAPRGIMARFGKKHISE